MASTDGGRCIRNAPYRAVFALRDTNNNAATNFANPSAQISVDSGTAAAVAATPTEIASSTGLGYVDLTAAEMTFTYQAQIVVDASGQTVPAFLFLTGEPCLDSGVIQENLTSTTTKLRASASSQDDLYNGAVIELVRGTGAGAVRTITDYVGSSKTITIDRAWDVSPGTSTVYIIHPRVATAHASAGYPSVNVTQLLGESTALTVMASLYDGGIASTVSASTTPSTTTFTSGSELTATADFYNRSFVVFTSGALQGLMRPISDYSAARLLTFDATDAWPTAPGAGDEFVVLSYRS